MKISLNPVPVFKVIERTDMIKEFAGKKAMAENMKKIIRIAKPLFKKEELAKYKTVKPESIGKTFLKFHQLMESTRGSDFGYSIDMEDGKLILCTHYYYPIYDYAFYVTPLQFLPDLAKKNLRLHNIIVDTVRYIATRKALTILSDLGFYDIEEWIGESMNYMDDDAKELKERTKDAEKHKKYYQKYYTLLNKPYTSRASLVKRIRNYRSTSITSPVEATVMAWCTDLIKVADMPGSMDNLIESSIEMFCKENKIDREDFGEDGYPLFPDQWMAFTWLNIDSYHESLGQWFGEIAGNFGTLEYHKEYKCTTQKQVKECRSKFAKECGFWPSDFTKVLEAGYHLARDIENHLKGKLIGTLSNGQESTERTIPA